MIVDAGSNIMGYFGVINSSRNFSESVLSHTHAMLLKNLLLLNSGIHEIPILLQAIPHQQYKFLPEQWRDKAILELEEKGVSF